MHRLLPLALALLCASASAQRADSSALSSAADAFGLSLGRETIGLYSSSSVRGFSPTAAGNVRLDGLYFDPIWTPNARLRSAGAIRVGLSSQGYPFPAPTGIVDYALRRPGDTAGGTASLGLDDAGGRYAEVDGGLPLGAGLSLQAGLSLTRSGYTNGTDGKGWSAGLGLWWRPSAALEVGLYSARSHQGDDEMSPQLTPAYAGLPPLAPEQSRFAGPAWADYDGGGLNHGLIARWQATPRLQLRAGLFHSGLKDHSSFAHLLLDVQADGSARRVIVADPPTQFRSHSGELRAVYSLPGEVLQQQWLLNLTGRARNRHNGGSQRIDFGATRIGESFEPPEPAWGFGPQTKDRVRQHTLGLAWGAQWRRQAEWMLGLQQSDYRKRVARPGEAVVARQDRPLLFNLSAAWHASPALALYASRSRGLEESGTAPDGASNRGQALPAIRTTQWDAGLRWQATPALRLVAGAFEVRKPYLNLDAANLFGELGEVSHRGLEASLSGAVTPRLDLLAGAVLMRPRVSGEAVRLGRIGERPVGQAERQLRLNLGWRPALLSGATLDLGLAHSGSMPATRDQRVQLPALTLVDLGLRWPLQLDANSRPWVLRLAASNLLNRRAFELRGAGSYAERPGRLVSASLARDF